MLLIGVILALVFRGVFIALGAAAIARFSWVFYLFGVVPALHGVQARPGTTRRRRRSSEENLLLRVVRRLVPTAPDYDGIRLRTVVDGTRLFTPMLVVMVAIGTTDVLFALDSIPAIFGLTKEPYLVFTANAFALMGLRPAVLPARRAAGPAGLPVHGLARRPRVHRREAGAGGAAREHLGVHQRRPAGGVGP